MRKLKFLLAMLLIVAGLQVAKAAETVIFEVKLDTLAAKSLSMNTPYSVLSTNGKSTGMTLFSPAALTNAIAHSQSEKCSSTDRMGLAINGGYLELPPLNNPATVYFTGIYTSSAAGRYLCVDKKVGAGSWVRVDSVPITNSTTNCTNVSVNVNTAGSVTLRVIHTIPGNTFMIYGGAPIKVTGMDMTPPALAASSALFPTGTGIALNASLRMKFDRPIMKGAGKISVYKQTGGVLAKEINVGDAGVSIEGDSTLVADVGNFDANTQYYVLVENGAIKGKNGVAFAGISSTSAWTFTTKASASSAKDILTFTIPNQDSSKINGSNISVWVKYKTNVTQLTVSAISLSPAAQISAPIGWTTSTIINFSTPQTFTVEAEDQSTKNYTVTVYVNANADATIKSMKLAQGEVTISADEIKVRTMAINHANVASLTINGAENSTILFRGTTYADTTTLSNVNISGSPTIKVTAADGVNSQTYTLIAVDADTAKLPLTVKGAVTGSTPRWNTIVTTKGWLLDATYHSSLYADASSRGPIRFMNSGDYIMLHCDSAPEKVSYYLRANALTTYKVLLEESPNGVAWTTAKETTADVLTSDFGKIESPLLQTTRFLRWTISNLAGGGSLMFDEVNVTKYVPGILSAEKDILSFSLLATNGKTYPGVVDKTSSKVTVMVPSGVALTGAKATFALSLRAAATVGGVTQVSGTTANDFTSGLTYKVTAENSTFANWTVEINRLTGPVDGIFQFNFSSGTLKAENYVVAGQEVGKVELTGSFTQTIGTLNACGQTSRLSLSLGNTATFPILPNMGYLEAHGWGVGSDNKHFVIEKKYEGAAEWVTVDTVISKTGCNTTRPIYINTHTPAQIRVRAYETGVIFYGVYTIYAADMVAPTLATTNALYPASGTTGLTSRPGKLEMTFSEPVKAGTGSITIYKTTGDVVDTTFDIKGAGVNFDGNKLTINFSKKLSLNTAYYVKVPAGVILDGGDNAFAGILNKTTWTFTTKTSESSDVSLLGVTLTTPTGTTSVSYGAPIAGTPVAGVTPLAQRVVYKTDPTQLKIAGFTLPAGAVVTSPTNWSTQTYNLFTTPLELTVTAEDNTVAHYSLRVSQVAGNHLANITSIRGDRAYARANLKDTTVVIRTIGYNGTYNIPNVLVLLADSAKITVAGKDSINRVCISSLNVTTPQSLKVVSHNGDSIKNWKISAKDIGKATVPVHFEASYADLSRVLALTDEAGWLPYNMMNEYEQSGNRRPSKMNAPGSYVILALNKVGDSVSYKTRAGSDKNYDFELRESADAVNWTSVIRHTKTQNPIYTSSSTLFNFKQRLNPSTRYLQWYLHSPGDVGDITQIRLDDIKVTERMTQSNEKKITKLSINGVNGVVIEAMKQIGVTLPAGTDVKALTPNIEVSYFATVNPASGTPRDFTNAVEYTVTAENGTTQKYTVIVIVEADDPSKTAVDKNSNAEFALYPNPVGSILNIGAEYEVASVAVYNQVGTLVYAVMQSSASVDLKALPSGLYYVQVKFANGKTGVKLINKQ